MTVRAFPVDVGGARAADWRARGLWRDETVESYLDRWATRRPDRTAMVDGEGRCTWAELARRVERVAHGLAAHGVEPGRTIACQLPNWSEFVVVLLAAARLGAVANPIPPIYRASELRFILNHLQAVALVIPGVFRGFDHAAMVAALRPEVPTLERVFVARGAPGPGMLPFSLLTEIAWEARAHRRSLPGTAPDDVHEVIFTSGTTGEPKGVMHTPNTVLANVWPVIERLDLSGRDVVLMASTFAHQTGYLFGYCATLALGATGVWLDVWSAERAARLVERERVTFTMGATPFLRDLTYVAGHHDFSSFRVFISAGAPIPRSLVGDARARLGCTISPGWGMTENGLVTCVGPRDPEEKRVATDGSPARGMELAILDAGGRPAPADTEGDLVVRGASQFVGYAGRPELTRECHTADGWFRTGDRGRIDPDGFLTITGRTKDLVIRGGENIPVAEVENVLFTHPKVAGVAVVAMPDARLGERACAFVVPRPGTAPTLAELVAFLDAHQLARQKFPERLELIDEFPMTPSGKVQKYRLREIIAGRLACESEAG
jgi:cyclohexanecarboxylate-CoA ligase